ncbi:MAG: hypothetical protein Q7S03_01060 [bacterium]|nr:hypothetical protein [bacterium]
MIVHLKRILGLVFLLFLLGSKPAIGDSTIINEDFSFDNPNFTLNGLAHRDPLNEELVLTDTCCGYAGSMFYNTPINTSHLNAEFDFRIDRIDPGGADGFTFTIIDSDSPTFLGTGGGGLGYSHDASMRSLAVEFDVHKNPGVDFDWTHIGVDLNGNLESVNIAQNVPEGEEFLEDQGTFHTEILLREGGKRIIVYLGNESINYPRTKIIDYVMEDVKPFRGLVGFTAGIGAFRDYFFIDNFTLQHNPLASP